MRSTESCIAQPKHVPYMCREWSLNRITFIVRRTFHYGNLHKHFEIRKSAIPVCLPKKIKAWGSAPSFPPSAFAPLFLHDPRIRQELHFPLPHSPSSKKCLWNIRIRKRRKNVPATSHFKLSPATNTFFWRNWDEVNNLTLNTTINQAKNVSSNSDTNNHINEQRATIYSFMQLTTNRITEITEPNHIMPILFATSNAS